MRVEKANYGDLRAIVQINQTLHLDIPRFRWDSTEWISQELAEGHFYVIRDQKEVIAAMCLTESVVQTSIDTIVVAKDKRNQGIGRALVEFAKSEAKSSTLTTKVGQKSVLGVESFCEYEASEFYKKCGFSMEPKLSFYEEKPYYSFKMLL